MRLAVIIVGGFIGLAIKMPANNKRGHTLLERYSALSVGKV